MLMDPCRNCNDRKLYCHDSCEKYALQKQQREEVNQKQRKYLDGRMYDGCLAPKCGKVKKYDQSRF